jgi:hypothetical protein
MNGFGTFFLVERVDKESVGWTDGETEDMVTATFYLA